MANASIGFFGLFVVGASALYINSCAVSGGKSVFQGISSLVSGVSYSDISYRDALDASYKGNTSIWRYHLMDSSESNWRQDQSDRSVEITDSDYLRTQSGIVRDRSGEARKRSLSDDLSDIGSIFGLMLPYLEADFSIKPSTTKIFLATNKYGGGDSGYVIFQAVHPEIRDGQPTIFRIKFQQYPVGVWEYSEAKYMTSVGRFSSPWSTYDRCNILDSKIQEMKPR